MSENKPRRTKKVISIDLGICSTAVACMDDSGENAIVLKLDENPDPISPTNGSLMPTVLYFVNETEFYIGEKARRFGLEHPEACIRNFKADLYRNNQFNYSGVTAEDGTELASIRPIHATNRFLNRLQEKIQLQLLKLFPEKQPFIGKAVLTVPAKFPVSAKEILKAAAKSVNLPCCLMQEPVAIAIAYLKKYPHIQNKCLMVYDWGGSSLDISVLRDKSGTLECKDIGGSLPTGGNLLTNIIASDMMRELNSNYHLEGAKALPLSPEDYSPDCIHQKQEYLKLYEFVWRWAEHFKIQFSKKENAQETLHSETHIFLLPDEDGKLQKVKHIFQRTADNIRLLIENKIEETIKFTEQKLREAEESGNPVDYLLLAGGSAMIPEVLDKLRQIPKAPEIIVYEDKQDDLSTLIAKGAVQGGLEEIRTQEYLSSDIGIKIRNAGTGFRPPEFQPILAYDKKNPKKLPYSNEKPVRVGIQDGCTEYHIMIFERMIQNTASGTSQNSNVILAGEFTVENIPDVPNRIASYWIQELKDGTLDVSVSIEADGKSISNSYTIKKRSNLLDE